MDCVGKARAPLFPCRYSALHLVFLSFTLTRCFPPAACASPVPRPLCPVLPFPATARGKPKPSKDDELVPGLPSKNDVAVAAAKRLAGI
jgi:hypothetical protein